MRILNLLFEYGARNTGNVGGAGVPPYRAKNSTRPIDHDSEAVR
jgi:hypothetical protein